MKLTGNRADAFLKSPPPDSLGALIFGPDRGMVRERAKTLARQFVTDPDDAFATTALTTDDLSEDSSRLMDGMTALSLLGDASLVTLRLDHERQGKLIADLIRHFDAEPRLAASRLIIMGGEMKTSSTIRKAVEASRHFAAIACYPDSARDLASLIKASLEEAGLGIRPDALGVWMERLDGDRALIRSEIEKMILYVGPDSGATITQDDIDANTVGAQGVTYDDIISNVFLGNVAKADDALRRAYAGRMAPIGILLSFQRHIMRLMEASGKTANGMGREQALNTLYPRAFGPRLQAEVTQLGRWPSRALQSALSQALDVEIQSKTAGAPVDTIVSRYALALADYASKRR